MKPTNVLLKRYKKLYPVKFQHILPLKLKDSISGKSDKQTGIYLFNIFIFSIQV